jgi:S1-C subfamily serine protease
MRALRNGIIWIIILGGLGVGGKILWPKLHPSASNAQPIASENATPTSQPTTRPAEPLSATASISITPIPTAPTSTNLTPAQIFERLSPSVVKIAIYDTKGDAIALGSGFIATPTGLIVTNYHVVKGAKSVKVFSSETNQLDVEGLANIDPEGDLALIKVKGKFPPPLSLAPAVPPAVGSRAFAIGNPQGLTNTFSEGLVSGVRQIKPDLVYIQTTAAITHGSSGGALVNELGQVLGVTTLGTEGAGNLAFAVDRDRIQRLLDSHNGEITAFAKQTWDLTAEERGGVGAYLSRAAVEAAHAQVDRGRIFGWIADAYVRTGDREGLRTLLDAAQLSTGNRDSGWYEEALAAGLRARLGESEKVSADLDTNPNPRIRIHGHVFIAITLKDRGDSEGFSKEIELASTLASKQADAILRADGLIFVTKALADAGNFEQAMAKAEQLEDSTNPMLDSKGAASGYKRNSRSVALSFIAIGRAKVGDFAETLAIASKIFDVTDACFVLSKVVELKAEADEPDVALKIAQRITVAHLRNHALLITAESFARANKRAEARDCITEARKTAKEIKEIWLIANANSELVGCLAACGEFDAADRIVTSLTDARQRSEAIGRIALAYAKRGDYRQMSDTLRKVTDPLAAIPSLNQIAVVQAKAGHVTAALQTTALIPITIARLEATRAIIKAGAAKLPAQDMANIVRRFPTSDQRAVGYLGLAEALIERDAANPTAKATEE